MRRRLQVESLFDLTKKLVEFLRPDHRPRDNIQLPSVKTSDEIRVLFILNYLLELERKSRPSLVEEGLRFSLRLTLSSLRPRLNQ